MSLDGAVERREDPPAGNGNGNGAVSVAMAPPTGRPTYGDRRLRLNPNTEHKPERYDDLETEFDPSIFSSLERHLPPTMLEVPRDTKIQFMKEILARYLPEGERTRVSLFSLLFPFSPLASWIRVSEIRVPLIVLRRSLSLFFFFFYFELL